MQTYYPLVMGKQLPFSELIATTILSIKLKLLLRIKITTIKNKTKLKTIKYILFSCFYK